MDDDDIENGSFFRDVDNTSKLIVEDYNKGVIALDEKKVQLQNNLYDGILYGFPLKGRMSKKRAYNLPERLRARQKSRYVTQLHKEFDTVMSTLKKIRYTWSIEEDNVLYEEAMRYMIERKPVSWVKIAKDYFYGKRTPRQLKARWWNHLDPALSSCGKWSADEVYTLIESIKKAMNAVGKPKYNMASIALGAKRTPISCRSKWINLKKIVAEKSQITEDEVTPDTILEILRIGKVKVDSK